MRFAWRTWFAGPRALTLSWLLGLCLVTATLANRPILDDLLQELKTAQDSRIAEIPHTLIDLFTFGRPGDNERLIERGILLPWWTDREYLVSFFRPFAALTHDADHFLWPHRAALAHLHTLAWYALLLAAVSRLYRELVQPLWLARFSFFLYVLDDTHADALGWTANRHAVIAAFLAVLSILSHHRWRRGPRGWGRAAIGPAFFAAGLLASESAAATLAYLLAYAVFLESGGRRSRLLSLVPYAILFVIWRLAYGELGFGASATSGYLDPVRSPLAFIARLPTTIVILVQGQLGYIPSDVWSWGSEQTARNILACAVLFCLVLVALVWPILRVDRGARFWFASMVGAFAPSAAALPSDRTLLFSGIAAMAFVARVFAAFFDGALARPNHRLLRTAAAITVTALLARRVLFAPVLLPLRARMLDRIAEIAQRVDRDASRVDDLAGKTLVVANPPGIDVAAYLMLLRAAHGETIPQRLRWFATGESEMTLTRTSDRSLSVRSGRGFLGGRAERVFRSPSHPILLGEQFVLSDMTVTITDLRSDGNPNAAEFRFRDPLESRNLVWMQCVHARCSALPLPGKGETVTLPATDPLSMFEQQ